MKYSNYPVFFRNILTISSMTALAAGFTACTSLHTVNLTADHTVASSSVQVDVVGVNKNDKSIETAPLRQYWQPGSPVRSNSNMSTVRFGPGQNQTQTIEGNWGGKGESEVVVIADLPGAFQDMPGAADPRRLIIPVSKAAKVDVLVTSGGLILQQK